MYKLWFRLATEVEQPNLSKLVCLMYYLSWFHPMHKVVNCLGLIRQAV